MKRFVKRHRDRLAGTLSGLDRILFSAAPGFLRYAGAAETFLSANHIPFADYRKFAEGVTEQLRRHAKDLAQREGRPFLDLNSPRISKEGVVRKILETDGVQQGLICVLTCVEPGSTYRFRKNPRTGKPRLKSERVPCQHLYFYYRDCHFGVMHLRVQSWIPFRIQVCLNGRDWLATRLARAAIGYEKSDNCFLRIDDFARAQKMMDQLLELNWVRLLNAWARRVCPWMAAGAEYNFGWYDWGVRQSEYATDLIFRSAADLAELYPALIHHALAQFRTTDVLRFLGRRNRRGNVRSRLLEPVEGLRIKHWVEENCIKMYNKAPNVLRVETTINQPKRFTVWRRVTRQARPTMAWVAMRKSVADLRRRAQASRAAKQRYLQALAVVGEKCPWHRVLDPVSQPVVVQDRRYRALHPISREDDERLALLQQGQFFIRGFRNKDLVRFFQDGSPLTRRQLSARVTRWLRILRAHSLIYRLQATHYYQITTRGHQVIRTALTLRNADVSALAA